MRVKKELNRFAEKQYFLFFFAFVRFSYLDWHSLCEMIRKLIHLQTWTVTASTFQIIARKDEF